MPSTHKNKRPISCGDKKTSAVAQTQIVEIVINQKQEVRKEVCSPSNKKKKEPHTKTLLFFLFVVKAYCVIPRPF